LAFSASPAIPDFVGFLPSWANGLRVANAALFLLKNASDNWPYMATSLRCLYSRVVEWCARRGSNPDKIQCSSGKSQVTSQTDSQAVVTACQELAQIVTAWAKLPARFKADILAIVGSVTSSPETKP
jgi:hypothetical protein